MIIPVIMPLPMVSNDVALALKYYTLSAIVLNSICLAITIVLLFFWFKYIRKEGFKFSDAVIFGNIWSSNCLIWKLCVWRNLLFLVITIPTIILFIVFLIL